MYLTFDLEGPVLSEFISNLKFKRMILKYWPVSSTLINGHQVMGRVMYYSGGSVKSSTGYKKIYKLLHTSVDQLNENDYQGIDKSWFEMQPFEDNEYVFDENDVSDLINQIDDKYSVLIGIEEDNPQQVTMFPPTNGTFPPVDNKQRYTDLFDLTRSSGDWDKFNYDTLQNKALALVLLDTGSEVFDIEVINLGTTNAIGQNNKVSTSASYSVSFKVKSNFTISAAYVARLNAAMKPIIIIDDYGGDDIKTYSLIAIQLKQAYRTLYIPSDIYVDGIPLFVYQGTWSGDDPIGYVTKVGLESLRASEFKKFFGKVLESGYQKKKVGFWKRLLSVILVIVAFLVAVFAPPFLIVVQLVQVAIQAYWVETGDYAAAAMMGRHMQIVQYIGYMTAGIELAKANELANKVAIETAKETGAEVATETLMDEVLSLTGYTSDMSLAQVLTQTINHTNTAFSFYAQYEARQTASELKELNEDIAKVEKQMNEMPTPKKYELIKWDFESYNFLEINESMQQVPYNMTQGKINAATELK